jgi:hypothetical protein
MTITKKPYAIEISPENLEQLRHYSEVTGVPMRHAANEALEMFFNVIAPPRLRAFEKKDALKLVAKKH